MSPRTRLFLMTVYAKVSRCGWTDYYIVHAETEEAAIRKFTLETGETPDRVEGPYMPDRVYFIGDSDDGVSGLTEVEKEEEE